MPNPVLAETGDFALSIPVKLEHFGGAISSVRGVLGRLPQSPGQLEGGYSDSDWCCWCDPPSNTTRVEYLTAHSIRWRVLDTEDEVGAAFASVNHGSIRYMLINRDDGQTPARHHDFDPTSFDPEDFR